MKPAQYLLRIDDLCPTVHAARWQSLRELLSEFGIKPILAVVPCNRDPELQVSPPDVKFWETLRDLPCGGAVIAIHGFQHLCSGRASGILPLSRSGEFAGVPYEIQHRWIREGLATLRREGLEPRLWVAPRHNFDRNTLRALREEGITYLSDGMTRRPVERGGMIWIPQQLWWPQEKRSGLWTLCVHPNTLADRSLADLRTFLRKNAGQFTSFERVVREFTPSPPRWPDLLVERAEIVRLRLRCAVSRRALPNAPQKVDPPANPHTPLPTDPGLS